MNEKKWSAILQCSKCQLELNRIDGIVESRKPMVKVGKILKSPDCPKGCYPVAKTFNMNVDFIWEEEQPEPPAA